jgi:hypothetical protein
MQQLSTFVYYLLPNFSDFSIAGTVSHGIPVSARLVLLNSAYALCYGTLLIVGAAWIFSRRDLK